ncbi:molybdopterin-dependent oxidoreductase [Halovenus sp. WSH3]|uniref:Molybdopterin-dependent oxidoreductase n=1 Tax=Halovenus carboxidivorans TaxID=2692199 RepID=A0A6B0T966_9EURY|nr:molybdopterin-dependent oxidoreductase [Halovenus carboxidivorans]MXR51892.1 molybdopterin-dependent oxidoreductase [Halovenus carboxidivorans]
MSGSTPRRLLAALRPPPRAVDWSIFAAVVLAAGSGVLSFLGVRPAWVPVFWFHRAVGLALTVLLGFKLARVRYRLTDRRQWRPSTALSVVTALTAIATIATGVLWVFGFVPEIPYFQFLSVHVGLGLLLVVLMVAHQRTRFRPPRRVDFQRRRTTMQYSVLLIAGALSYRGQQALNAAFDTPGDERRLTGSRRRDGDGNASFPVTSWVADSPDPVDIDAYRLSVEGAVDASVSLSYDQLDPTSSAEVLLDCTSGWYTEQEWEGVAVGDLLDLVDPDDAATHVRFVSVTGYRWSLPIEEAREAMLATHVGGERLSHGHGRPLRLVAPGRRGFQWVKWVERVEVRKRGDPAQWLATLISGFD